MNDAIIGILIIFFIIIPIFINVVSKLEIASFYQNIIENTNHKEYFMKKINDLNLRLIFKPIIIFIGVIIYLIGIALMIIFSGYLLIYIMNFIKFIFVKKSNLQ